MNKQWIKRWKNWVAPTKLPGVWQRKEGGCLVRARVTESTTGRQREIKKVLPHADEAAAYQWLAEETARVRAGVTLAAPQKTRFAEFAASHFEEKVKLGQIRSARGRAKWATVLGHLIAGTTGESSGTFVSGFGEFYLEKLDSSHVESWAVGVAGLIKAGDYAPTTCNGWLAILRVIMKAARRKLRLPHLATEGVDNFDTSEHQTYSEEEPNSLLPDEVPTFMALLREMYPQHFGMVFLALATGLRPSSLRPLRRRGPSADILWDERKLLVRRSHTMGTEVMNTTKQRVKYSINLPAEVVDVLRWHVDTQLGTPEQQESALLFPSVTGGFRAGSVLNKPLADVAHAVNLGKHFTQLGLRRTFNDLARAAQVEAIVTRSISGHLTESMQSRYSTVNAAEQRESIGKVIELMQVRARSTGGAPGGAPDAEVVLRNEKAS